ncbi:uncharacterized protein BDZ99DRAFT_457242 [Mytilinidion resinicola]|uniref:F-box domain-containing protein n=1 Tax=Mytilinidion resinicola TaxID=574789 RepID=A0A6A6Z925_9PEZI|nr:uncharacterized protein BDZ99DRAFT_457242 [Mytilinidion resinicola]KAF2817520.1 hypothetical protein BDZ99DRAFT_457242 [Mytilinidion resinicola]
MATFSDLPVELIIDIGEYLPGSDIKALRLTDRVCKSAIAHLLFPRLYVSSHELDLKVLKHVSETPELAKGVKQLVCDGGYDQLAPGYRKIALERLDETRAAWDKEDSGVVDALPYLTSLRSMVLCCPKSLDSSMSLSGLCAPSTRAALSEIGTEYGTPEDRRFNVRAVGSRLLWRQIAPERRMELFNSTETSIDVTTASFEDIERLNNFRHLNLLLDVCITSPSYIKEFIIPPFRTAFDEYGACMGAFVYLFESWNNTLDRMRIAFTNLEVLHLCFLGDYDGESARILLQGNLTTVLSSCKELRELKIDNSECLYPLATHLPTISALDLKKPLPKLRRATFIAGSDDAKSAFRVIRAHAASLEYLEFKSINLKNGDAAVETWTWLLEALRGLPNTAEFKKLDLVCDLVGGDPMLWSPQSCWNTVKDPDGRKAAWTQFLDGGAFPLREPYQDFEDPPVEIRGKVWPLYKETQYSDSDGTDSMGADWDWKMEEWFPPLDERIKLYVPSIEGGDIGSAESMSDSNEEDSE